MDLLFTLVDRKSLDGRSHFQQGAEVAVKPVRVAWDFARAQSLKDPGGNWVSRTKQTFDRFRFKYPEKGCPPVQNVDQQREMGITDGLELWQDGPGDPASGAAPALEKNHPHIHLWVVRAEDVVHAPERCSFGAGLESGMIKHSNLTGARPAHCGGQLVFLENGVIALDGGSGRFGPGSKDEMIAVAKAFKNSGYGVWSYGYDEENAWPFRIGSRLPELVK